MAPDLVLARELKYNQICQLYCCTILICFVVLVEKTEQCASYHQNEAYWTFWIEQPENHSSALLGLQNLNNFAIFLLLFSNIFAH